MTTMGYATADYGTWNDHGDRLEATVAATVTAVINGGDREWRQRLKDTGALQRIVDDYTAAINAALPSCVSLYGDQFIGPWHPHEHEFDGYPLDEHGSLDIATIVQGIDLMEIVAKHDPDAN